MIQRRENKYKPNDSLCALVPGNLFRPVRISFILTKKFKDKLRVESLHG